jgi:transposase
MGWSESARQSPRTGKQRPGGLIQWTGRWNQACNLALPSAWPARRERRALPDKEQRQIDTERYKDRNLAERFWHKVKQFRRVATRYEKTARNFLAFVHVASIIVLLR